MASKWKGCRAYLPLQLSGLLATMVMGMACPLPLFI